MAGISDFLAGKLLAQSTGRAQWTIPSATYLALTTSEPTGSSTGSEAIGDGYERKPVVWAAPVGRTQANSNTVTYQAFGGAGPLFGGVILGWVLWDNAIQGNPLWYDSVVPPRTLVDSSTLVFEPGTIILEFSD